MLRTILATAAVAASLTAGASVMASADQPTHEVPTWMRQVCAAEDSVNCYWPGGSKYPVRSEAYIREVGNTVCVFYVNRPKRDHCA